MGAKPDPNREDVLRRVNAYLSEVPDMESDEAIQRYVKEAGVEISEVQERAKTLVTKVIAGRRLDRARVKRAEKLRILERIKVFASQLGSSAAQQLQDLVYSSDLEGAQMLARKFEKLHPEDVASLQEDLAFLRELEKEKDPDVGK
jgi:hypothetical protein